MTKKSTLWFGYIFSLLHNSNRVCKAFIFATKLGLTYLLPEWVWQLLTCWWWTAILWASFPEKDQKNPSQKSPAQHWCWTMHLAVGQRYLYIDINTHSGTLETKPRAAVITDRSSTDRKPLPVARNVGWCAAGLHAWWAVLWISFSLIFLSRQKSLWRNPHKTKQVHSENIM